MFQFTLSLLFGLFFTACSNQPHLSPVPSEDNESREEFDSDVRIGQDGKAPDEQTPNEKAPGSEGQPNEKEAEVVSTVDYDYFANGCLTKGETLPGTPSDYVPQKESGTIDFATNPNLYRQTILSERATVDYLGYIKVVNTLGSVNVPVGQKAKLGFFVPAGLDSFSYLANSNTFQYGVLLGTSPDEVYGTNGKSYTLYDSKLNDGKRSHAHFKYLYIDNTDGRQTFTIKSRDYGAYNKSPVTLYSSESRLMFEGWRNGVVSSFPEQYELMNLFVRAFKRAPTLDCYNNWAFKLKADKMSLKEVGDALSKMAGEMGIEVDDASFSSEVGSQEDLNKIEASFMYLSAFQEKSNKAFNSEEALFAADVVTGVEADDFKLRNVADKILHELAKNFESKDFLASKNLFPVSSSFVANGTQSLEKRIDVPKIEVPIGAKVKFKVLIPGGIATLRWEAESGDALGTSKVASRASGSPNLVELDHRIEFFNLTRNSDRSKTEAYIFVDNSKGKTPVTINSSKLFLSLMVRHVDAYNMWCSGQCE